MKRFYYVLMVVVISMFASCGEVKVNYVTYGGKEVSSDINYFNNSYKELCFLELQTKEATGEISWQQYQLDVINLEHHFNVLDIKRNYMIDVFNAVGVQKPFMFDDVNVYTLDFKDMVIKFNGEVIFDAKDK